MRDKATTVSGWISAMVCCALGAHAVYQGVPHCATAGPVVLEEQWAHGRGKGPV